MITEYKDCLVRCARGAQKRLLEQAANPSAFSVMAHHFKCPDCGAFWTSEDFSGATSPHLVTCSNCYGSRVLITRLRMQTIEPKDFVK
jgi:hypothetical protein